MSTACVCCNRPLWDDEQGRPACLICEKRGVAMLRDLPALYRQAGARLERGSTVGGGRVSGSRSAPLPCSEEALALRGPGGLVDVLASWERCFREDLAYTLPTFRGDYEQTLTGIVGWLVTCAPWIYGSHAAADEFHGELRRWHGQAKAIVEGEARPTQLNLQCDCGTVLKGITLQTDGRRCTGCGTQYGWTELCQLPLVNRRAAA